MARDGAIDTPVDGGRRGKSPDGNGRGLNVDSHGDGRELSFSWRIGTGRVGSGGRWWVLFRALQWFPTGYGLLRHPGSQSLDSYCSSPYANNNVLRRNSLQRIVFYSGQRIVLPTPSGALLDLIMCISQGP
jgi:hypothetical protein